MAITFPSSPTDGQKFIQGTVIYTYSAATQTWTAAPLGTALPFNYIINPDMKISQQNGSTGSTVAGYYPADQWVMWYGTTANPYGVRYTDAVNYMSPKGSPNRLIMEPSIADAAVAATDHAGFWHSLEGNRIADFQFGTANAKQLVLTFGVRSGIAGTFGGSIRNAASDRGHAFSYTISEGEINTDVYRTFVIPGCTDGVWAKDNTLGMSLGFVFMCGTTYAGAPGSWLTGNILGPTGAANGMATLSKQFHLFDVGLYVDPNLTGRAPPWEVPSEHQAMLDCTRFYQKLMSAFGVSVASTISPQRPTFPLQGQMRAAPAGTLVGTQRAWDVAAAPNLVSFYGNYSNTYYVELNMNSSSAMAGQGRGTLFVDSSPTVYTGMSARF